MKMTTFQGEVDHERNAIILRVIQPTTQRFIEMEIEFDPQTINLNQPIAIEYRRSEIKRFVSQEKVVDLPPLTKKEIRRINRHIEKFDGPEIGNLFKKPGQGQSEDSSS